MQRNGSWLTLLGAICVSLLPSISAYTQISDPNLYVIRQFNIVLTDNTKVSDLFCCMGIPSELPSAPQYKCFEHQVLNMGLAPGSRRMGIQYCHHLRGSTPDEALAAFKDNCSKATGEYINPDKGLCPRAWPNYKDDYKKPAPAPAALAAKPGTPDPASAADASNPNASGKATNDKDGFKTQGTFHYSLVDHSITRALACCKASNAPIVTPQKYKCAQRKVTNSTFMRQCAKVLPTITNSKTLQGYTTIDGRDDTIVDEKTKQQCSAMWTNAITYTYGFCKLDYDYAADEAIKAFGDDCAAKGGKSKEPHSGMCLWHVDDAAEDSSTG
ncbi:hypothetical protein NDA13_003264 [Ustilago tritici]|nr:hypothetical protein NDA13_003264 [Ustilago tritici]